MAAADIDHAALSSEHRQILIDSHPDAFVDLPAPFSDKQAVTTVTALATLKSAFQRRLDELKSIGHAGSIDLAENDLNQLEIIANELDRTLSSFE